MKDENIHEAIAELTRTSKASITFAILGACSLVGVMIYSATRLTPLEQEVSEKKELVRQLSEKEIELSRKISEKKSEYDALKSNVEKLYAVQVTEDSFVFQVKATAKATGGMTPEGPKYSFRLYLESDEETLGKIDKVKYVFDHPTFTQPVQESTERKEKFFVGYTGWGCLTSVKINIKLHSGEEKNLDFNMCESLGDQWG